MEQTTDHLRDRQQAPQSSPSMHQTPLYVLMTPDQHSGNLLTLPGAELLHGKRGSTSIERNAFHIVHSTQIGSKALDFTPTAVAWIGDDESRKHGMAYLVERASESEKVKEKKNYAFIDLTHLEADQPLPDHELPLELHDHQTLLRRLERICALRDEDNEQAPSRDAELAFVRAYGRYILQHSLRTT